MHGNVSCITLIDNKNLDYRNGSKKVYIYVPNHVDPKTARFIVSFDGQNLFYKANGEYPKANCDGLQVDCCITDNKYNYIVVGIDNSDNLRDRELTMSEIRFGQLDKTYSPDGPIDSFKNGKLDNLGDFINQTLFPYLEKKFDRAVTAQHCYITGASSGGLASLYLGLRDHYKAILAMSPAVLLFSNDLWQRFYKGKDLNLPIYLSNGYKEGYLSQEIVDMDLESRLCIATRREYEAMKKLGFTDLTIDLNKDYEHNEKSWKKIFSDFLAKKEGKSV